MRRKGGRARRAGRGARRGVEGVWFHAVECNVIEFIHTEMLLEDDSSQQGIWFSSVNYEPAPGADPFGAARGYAASSRIAAAWRGRSLRRDVAFWLWMQRIEPATLLDAGRASLRRGARTWRRQPVSRDARRGGRTKKVIKPLQQQRMRKLEAQFEGARECDAARPAEEPCDAQALSLIHI